jgi:uncharacterized membrane protein (DUF2068 family)
MSTESSECGEPGTKRPMMVTTVVIVHLLVTLGIMAIILYLLWLTRSPELLQESDAADPIHGLKIGAMVLAIPVTLLAPGIYGLWKRRVWGWWLAMVAGVGMASVFLYSAVDDGWRRLEADDAAVTGVFMILPLLLLLPGVRKYYRKHQGDPPAAIGTVPGITHTT